MKCDFNSEELGFILHLLDADYMRAGGQGYSRKRIERIIKYKKKVVELWLDSEHLDAEKQEENNNE